jgi:hypothetical protein
MRPGRRWAPTDREWRLFLRHNAAAAQRAAGTDRVQRARVRMRETGVCSGAWLSAADDPFEPLTACTSATALRAPIDASTVCPRGSVRQCAIGLLVGACARQRACLRTAPPLRGAAQKICGQETRNDNRRSEYQRLGESRLEYDFRPSPLARTHARTHRHARTDTNAQTRTLCRRNRLRVPLCRVQRRTSFSIGSRTTTPTRKSSSKCPYVLRCPGCESPPLRLHAHNDPARTGTNRRHENPQSARTYARARKRARRHTHAQLGHTVQHWGT